MATRNGLLVSALSTLGFLLAGCAAGSGEPSGYTDSDRPGKQMKRGEFPGCSPSTDSNPTLIAGRLPKIPKKELRYGRHGFADVRFVVGESGNVEEVEVLRATVEEYAIEVEEAVANWRFRPAKNDGHAIKVQCKKRLSYSAASS